jgi:hypothetical protein
MVKSGGIAARVQGQRRFYALLLCDDQTVRLVKALDGDTVLAQAPLAWKFGGDYDLRLVVQGNTIVGYVDGKEVVRAADTDRPLEGGGVALVVEEGRMATEAVSVGRP